MKRTLSLPDIAMIAATRFALGVGIGLLLSDRMNRDQRIAAGCSLATFGVLTTFPMAAKILRKRTDAPGPVRLAA
jgi:hypothetical protein